MCGIGGILNLSNTPIRQLDQSLNAINELIKHRGPDGVGTWKHPKNTVGFAHRRLSIIDLTTGAQPMSDDADNTVTYNGEIYNFIELREELGVKNFKTTSDTEVVLRAYQKWGAACVEHFRGMFAFALWDEKQHKLFCARDRFGIKPFYYGVIGGNFYFASEPKALLPFLETLEPSIEALNDYLVMQLCLDGKTLFKGISELLPGHMLQIENGSINIRRYWEVYYNLDFDHASKYFQSHLEELINDSVRVHLRADVPVGSYVSGGVDSGIVAAVAAEMQEKGTFQAFTGKFELGELYDESAYARALAQQYDMKLFEIGITAQDFIDSISKVIYHLDYPVAGPGSFPQYHVSKLAAKHRKVVLGGQGGDEIFGGYVRYLAAYFEQCIKGAIENKLSTGNFIVTYESIIPNLVALQNYKPMLQDFWRDGLFENIDARYYRLVNRAQTLDKEIRWNELGDYKPFETFKTIFNGNNVGKESYFDRMTHFDFKTLLPALLQVEDRMSMAHGLESRVPFLDHPIVEFAATMPSNIKFKDGTLKMVLVNSMKHKLPEMIYNRKNKMGFPVPLNEWLQHDIKDYVMDIFQTQKARKRQFFHTDTIIDGLTKETKFGRKVWGLLSLELWHQEFIDQHEKFKRYLKG
jgi:asparagine synthase (glutamine-hydrolysing)